MVVGVGFRSQGKKDAFESEKPVSGFAQSTTSLYLKATGIRAWGKLGRSSYPAAYGVEVERVQLGVEGEAVAKFPWENHMREPYWQRQRTGSSTRSVKFRKTPGRNERVQVSTRGHNFKTVLLKVQF